MNKRKLPDDAEQWWVTVRLLGVTLALAGAVLLKLAQRYL